MMVEKNWIYDAMNFKKTNGNMFIDMYEKIIVLSNFSYIMYLI